MVSAVESYLYSAGFAVKIPSANFIKTSASLEFTAGVLVTVTLFLGNVVELVVLILF
jgi:hypothetical protein